MKKLTYSLAGILLVLLLASGFVLAEETEMETLTSEKSGTKIVLSYPEYTRSSDARSFLARREKELSLAEELLKAHVSAPIEIQIDPVLISGGGGLRQLDVFYYSVSFSILSGHYDTSRFFYPNCKETRKIGVHEMIHLVAKRKLNPNPLIPPFISEGLAEAMDFIHRPKGVVDPHLVSKGLLMLNEFRSLKKLLKLPRMALTWPDQKKHLY